MAGIMDGDVSRVKLWVAPESVSRDQISDSVESYKEHFTSTKTGADSLDKRKENYAQMINHFYDLVTSFYEYGWGQSFHFAPRKKWESFEVSIHRHEFYLAHRLAFGPGMTALDCGCGVGGPARYIAVFSDAKVVGLNNNAYQVERAKKITHEAGLSDQVTYLKGDFCHIPAEDETYDAVYGVEATCHAPDKKVVYGEMYRVLKPGRLFGIYEWVMTDKYDPTDAEHQRIKYGVEKGNGLPNLDTYNVAEDAVRQVGFEILDSRDLSYKSDAATPWFLPLSGSLTISGFKHTRWGRWFTHKLVTVLETIHIAPKGTTEISRILCETADDLVTGGQLDIFTPCWFILARKPE